VAGRIVGKLEALEGVPIHALDGKRREAYISQLSDIVMKAARPDDELDLAQGIQALAELRQVGLGRN